MSKTTSLELSKKLYEAFPEWDIDTNYHWEQWKPNKYSNPPHQLTTRHEAYEDFRKELLTEEPIQAYDTDFLLEHMPKFVDFNQVPHQLRLEVRPITNEWWASYSHINDVQAYADTPAEALGNLALMLKEKGLL